MAHLPLCLGRRAAALPAGRGWDAEAVLMFVLLISAILLLLPQKTFCLPSAAASAELGKQISPVLCMRREEFVVFILFLALLETPLLSGGVEMNRFLCWKHPKWMVSFPCLNPVCAFEKLFTGASFTCSLDLKQQVLTTGFPPMLIPLWFAGFGHCSCLPAFT